MQRLTALIRADREFKNYLSTMSEAFSSAEKLPIAVNGLSGGAEDAFIVESVIEARELSGNTVLVLAPDESEGEKLLSLLREAGLTAELFKKRELVFHNISASRDIERERLSVLSRLQSGTLDAVVSTPSAASLYTVPPKTLAALSLRLSVGDVLAPDELAKRLSALGFSAVDGVEGAGQFARRGGIVDFWGGGMLHPVRVEFFGDEVDRLASFDPISQRSVGVLSAVELLPASEVTVSAEARARITLATEKLLSASREQTVKERLGRELTVLKSSLSVDFRDRYLGLIFDERVTLFDYFKNNGGYLTVVSGTSACLEELKKQAASHAEQRSSMLAMGQVTEEGAVYSLSESEYEASLSDSLTIHVNPFAGGVGKLKLSGLFGFRCRRTVSYGGNSSMLFEDLENLRKGLYRTLLVCENRQGADSLYESLSDAGIAASVIYDKPEVDISLAEGGRVFITVGTGAGYDLIMPKIAVLSMAQDEGRAIMANRRRQRILRQSGGAGKRLLSYAELSVGDYVVHANYGIGLFEGIESVTVDGIIKDYITIRYAGTDKLFVPCDRIDMIGKYIGAREKDGSVKLSKMGGGDWTRAKSRAKSAARDIAKELIALYAERQRLSGFAFPEDCDLENSFADAFEYELTDSQAQAIREIKSDMTKAVPMNRLLCGDVGFGKTEVALRAAFKAIMGGKQVAILVPTTILALQHYQTALSRMRGYPVTVEMLSRFKKPKEQEEILRRVKRGQTDILIGTHRMLSKELQFRDLGLLIIDEEQRFGVSQKEKLKAVAKNVDVLTLTATPIPRTLNMAMNGISDISILDEAPGERRPVQTYVLEHDDALITDALRRELARGGQTLYLYNKVEDIARRADVIAAAIPEARVAYAHGQMEKDELEDIWQMLVRGDIDILVCTTIIETGVDLPNANTLVIENADRFGLSQLHQIRGRVGRSERQAYAYFTYRQGKALSEVAEKRLAAIREYAEFGAGFRIALCDLEIRGAGNLLGAEQHGYIDSVGYDLYVKLLNEAVAEAQGRPIEKKAEATVDIRVNAHIPESYISTSAERMDMYKKISLITSPEDERDIADELMDRFGEMPKAVERLLTVSLVRAVCEWVGIKRVEARGGVLTFYSEGPLDLPIWSELFVKHPGMQIMPGGDRVTYRYEKRDPAECAGRIMRDYYDIKADEEGIEL